MNAFARLRQRLRVLEEDVSSDCSSRQQIFVLLVLGCALLVLVVAYFARVSESGSDPRPSLLVSQAILKQHTVRLDAYMDSPTMDLFYYTQAAENGHRYYFWPLGPSVFSLPVVWLANLRGKDMADYFQNEWTQNLISSLLSSLVFVILYKICRRFTSPLASLTIAVVSTFGSALISTMGTALWNIDYAVLFISLALLQLSYLESGEPERTNPYLLGALLFCAYFSRPSTSTFILATLSFLLLRHRRVLIKTAAVALILLSGFLAFSWLEYGKPFPDYYSVRRFQVDRDPLWMAVYGLLFSPSRGILIYSPFLALIVAGVLTFFRGLWQKPLFWFAATWFGLHIAVASRSVIWWGGHSFGPRILTEVIPALVLLTVLLWRLVVQESSPRAQKAAATGYVLLGLVALFINSYQGLYNVNTQRWNSQGLDPNVDYQAYVVDWRYPQFLATNQSICARNRDLVFRVLERDTFDMDSYKVGDPITYANPNAFERPPSPQGTSVQSLRRAAEGRASPSQHRLLLPAVFFFRENAVFMGWSDAVNGFRWSQCPEPRIIFRLEDEITDETYVLRISSGSYNSQQAIVSLNGTRIGAVAFPGPELPPVERAIRFDGTLLRPGAINELKFSLPDARSPSGRDPRQLGLALSALWIDAANEEKP